MSPRSLPDGIELDGVVELVRCPDLQIGWSAADIRVIYSPDTWHVPRELRHLRDEWERRHPGERSDPKVALRELRLDQHHALVCQLQATAWREVRPLHEGPTLDEDALVRRQIDGYEMLLPNIGVVHVIASTRDGWILAFRRSTLAHYHPGCWSATYEEGLAPEDIDGDNAVFQQAARRGLAEELMPDAYRIELGSFRVVSVVLERPLGNPAVVVMADLPLTLDELPAEGPSDEIDVSALAPIPVDRTCLRDIISAPAFEHAQSVGRWHPTSGYRLLMAMAHFFGEEAASDALSRVQPA